MEFLHQRSVERLVDERRLPRSRDTGDDRQDADRDLRIDALEVVLPAAREPDEPVAPPARSRNLDPEIAGEVAAGDRCRVCRDGVRRPFRDDVTAVEPGSGPHVHDPVGAPDGILVVLHHDEGVPEVAEVLQGLEEFPVVPLVQPDGGLVEDIEHPREVRPDLRREAYPLRFPAREAACAPREGQVADADLLQELQPGGDLLQDLFCDLALALGEVQRPEERARSRDREVGDLDDGLPGDLHGKHLLFEPPALALRAGEDPHELLEFVATVLRLGLVVEPFGLRGEALPRPGVRP
ncbi:hypothetical protein DSECCO2_634060 [anaerobic digester metagenome]